MSEFVPIGQSLAAILARNIGSGRLDPEQERRLVERIDELKRAAEPRSEIAA